MFQSDHFMYKGARASGNLSVKGCNSNCLADVTEFAGGAAVYAGKELPPKEWSCALLAAKSKMMKETLPVCDTDVCRTSFHGE